LREEVAVIQTPRSSGLLSSDVNKARTLKAKAMAIPMQRLTMKYEVMKSCFFEYSYKDTSTV